MAPLDHQTPLPSYPGNVIFEWPLSVLTDVLYPV